MAAGSHYSDQQRREAVLYYHLHGNVAAVASATSIPASTIRDWMAAPWWGMLSVEVRAEKGAELDGIFTRIITTATQQLLDRLTNGDPVLVAGQIKRKPVSARDLALVSAITFDKRALARSETTPPPTSDLGLEELLRSLKAYGKEAQEQDSRER